MVHLDKRGRTGLRADINVTPLVDVVLVLLIIFMLVAPMLTRGKALQLPAAIAVDPDRPAGVVGDVVLSLTADKQWWLETRAIEPAPLIDELRKRRAAGAVLNLLIRADARVSMRELRPVLRELKRAGVGDVALAVLDPHAAPSPGPGPGPKPR